MRSSFAVPLSCVSYHAVSRYCERFLGLVDPCPDPVFGPGEAARLNTEACGTTIEAVRATILTPVVALAIVAGAHRVRTTRMLVTINNAVVVTVSGVNELPPLQDDWSRAEYARSRRKQQRRFRHAPARRTGLAEAAE